MKTLNANLGAFALTGLCFVPPVLWLTTPLLSIPWVEIPTVSSLAIYPWAIGRLRIPRGIAIRGAIACGLVVGVLSVITGHWNGLTDERWSFALEQRMLVQGTNPYSTIHCAVNPSSGTSACGYLWDLPLTIILVVPGLDYGWQMLCCWLVLAFLLRERLAGLVMAQPFVALLAANGYPDLLPLLMLTLAYVGVEGKKIGWAEYLALGLKQFADVIVVARYLLKRDWRKVAVSLLVLLVFIGPFLAWNSGAFVCHAVVFEALPSCPRSPDTIHPLYVPNTNYLLWPAWGLSLWWAETMALLRRMRHALARVPHVS